MMNIAVAQTMIGMVEVAGSVRRGSRDADKGGAVQGRLRVALRRAFGGWPMASGTAKVAFAVTATAGTPILDRARAV